MLACLTLVGPSHAGTSAKVAESDTAPARTSLPAKEAVSMVGAEQLFEERLAITIYVDPVLPAEDSDDPSGPGKNAKGGIGKKRDGSGGFHLQANNRGTSAGANYALGSTNLGPMVVVNRDSSSVLGGGVALSTSGIGSGHKTKGKPPPTYGAGHGCLAQPEAVVHVVFTNCSTDPIDLYIIDLATPLGSFTIHPNRIKLAPEQTLVADPLFSFLAAGVKSSEFTLALRLGSARETTTIQLRQVPETGEEPVPSSTVPTGTTAAAP